MDTTETLDCKGMACPMPIVKISKAMKGLSSGETLEVVADDPGFDPDVNAWCNKTGNELVSLKSEGDLITAVIKKS
jgi:tRNA 2-thiouridine synthesizing protein A